MTPERARPATASDLDAPLDRHLGAVAKQLEKHFGITTVGGLLHHYPRTYLERGELTPIADVPVDEEVTLIARVQSANSRRMRTRKGMLLEVVITDDTEGGLGGMNLTFFNGYGAERDLKPGVRAVFSGKVTVYRGKLSLTNPRYAPLEEGDTDPEDVSRPIPVYPAVEKLGSEQIAKAVGIVLDTLQLAELDDPVPASIVRRDALMSLATAYELLHRPHRVEDAYRAQHRFRYQEAFVLQSALARRRALAAREDATARPPRAGGLLEQFDARLPFTLTQGQLDVGHTLAEDLARDHPMNRLLQGEVGSGKTLVALRAMLQVIDAGGQAALLAPTEVLAAQHLQSITRTLGPLAEGGMLGGAADGTRVVLLTGSMNTAQRRKSLLEAASGDAGIIIGTHALLSDNVQFFDLGLIVVDEQHRFGVEQRDSLRTKARTSPHVLVMTATPIPRTVAMTVFGDLETSTLSELPAGRSPITTHEVGLTEHPAWVDRIWARAREEIDAGRQVYVVCPKIGDDGKVDDDAAEALYGEPQQDRKDAGPQELTSVVGLLDALGEVPQLDGVALGMLHGRVDPQEKADVMARFAEGSVQLLIATTVIEVGVDVPNATLMVIMDADRFGISQLHQLRGRIGRGGHAGTCLLVTKLEPGHPSRERLSAVASTTDGFELSQKDLELRREGNILGASQSGGRSALRFLRITQHGKVIEKARTDAQEIVGEDPDLAHYPGLSQAIDLYLNPEKEAFLEKG
ncbi:ATP-dependent DNA helicase RecG [Arthrobacter agilis]|uniref:ATP-dependent DNA helicase RecG n=1 Tax=Arthrobacter agilis TaxID=37921 RepID=UPI000B35014E|nr:ATP-dependent DNA helicase RecG [Arthrobacter agilis]OUM44845.1 ATP-dependent DNA helicase RecG [Arthrobacter agilis]PPB47169.1 ATP-dependent DNA helicase RecG [Arthrobacter agilis]TPV22583.1 ATP-dependent DNA helicase RecG [Arthrobacter agilis]VDR32410.1 ATP-dependent DNA helicase recG [Arthrobacter agilis]